MFLAVLFLPADPTGLQLPGRGDDDTADRPSRCPVIFYGRSSSSLCATRRTRLSLGGNVDVTLSCDRRPCFLSLRRLVLRILVLVAVNLVLTSTWALFTAFCRTRMRNDDIAEGYCFVVEKTVVEKTSCHVFSWRRWIACPLPERMPAWLLSDEVVAWSVFRCRHEAPLVLSPLSTQPIEECMPLRPSRWSCPRFLSAGPEGRWSELDDGFPAEEESELPLRLILPRAPI